MKQLMDHIQKSIWSPEYYDELLTRKAGFSWKYYWSVAMLIAVVMTIVTSLPLLPKLNSSLRAFPSSFLSYYPDQLEITVEKGHVRSNTDEPYFLPLPVPLLSSFGSTSGVSFLTVIDTKTPVTMEQFISYHSLFWVSEHSVAYMDQQGSGMRVTTLTPDMSFSVTEQTLRGLIARVEPFFHFLPPLLVVVIFLVLMIRFIVNLVYLLVASLFIFLIGLSLRRKWSYGTSYRIALHATTLPLLIEQIFLFAPLPFPRLPFLFTAMLLIVVAANYYKPASSKEAPTPRT